MPKSNAFGTRTLFLIMTMSDTINRTQALIKSVVGNAVRPSVMNIEVNLIQDGLDQQKESKHHLLPGQSGTHPSEKFTTHFLMA